MISFNVYVFYAMFLSIRMEMTSQIKSWLSKRSVVTIGGNLEVDRGKGGGAASAVLNHQLSKVSSIEFMASAGLRALIGVRASRWVICFLQIYLNNVLLPVLVMLCVFLVHYVPGNSHHSHLQQWDYQCL